MKKYTSNPRLQQTLDGLVGVVRCRVVVTPISQGGRAAIELIERTHQGGNVDIARFEIGCQASMNIGKVFQYGPIAGDPTQCSLPSVHVSVDKSRNHNHASAVYDLSRG